ncbi:DUF5753 domain-containing protein [Streptomyces tricolor]|nr:DUF5753 domain-containing protein [Streptomyces tricolor]
MRIEVLGTDGFFRAALRGMCGGRDGLDAAYFEKVLEAEKHALVIEEWCRCFSGAAPSDSGLCAGCHPGEASRCLSMPRWRRRSTHEWRARDPSDGSPHPGYWVILHGWLVTDPILPPLEMAEQLDRIVELAERRRITPQIVPRKQKAYPLMAASIMTMTFPDAPPLVYTEASYTGDTIDDPVFVEQYRKAYDRLRAVALSPDTSLAMIKAAAEDYRNGKQADRLE